MKTNWQLMLLILFGMGLRVLAFHYNDLPHGDINIDYGTADSWHKQGRLITPIAAPRPYTLTPSDIWGYPQDQHGPLWSILGGFGAFVVGDAYRAFKIMTVIGGSLLIGATFFVFRPAFGEKSAMFAAVCVTFSYILIDYSGNGSLYIGHALFLLLFVGLSAALRQRRHAVMLGLVMGGAYLLNYQAITLLLSLLFLMGVFYLRSDCSGLKLRLIVLSFVVAFIVILPWLIRNQLIFNSPFYSVNANYIWSKLGAVPNYELVDNNLLATREWDGVALLPALTKIFVWTVRNSLYMVARLLILAPLLWPIVLIGGWQFITKRAKISTFDWVIGLALVSHMVISCLWPVFKFRYFVPLMPLLFGWGSGLLFRQVERILIRRSLIGLTIISLIVVNFLTYWRVPSHTSYYDNNELIHWRTGEVEWYVNARFYQEALAHIPEQKDCVLLAQDHAAFYFTQCPVVLNPIAIQDKTKTQWMVEHYDVRYIIAAPEQAAYYQTFLPIDLLFRNEGYMLFALD